MPPSVATSQYPPPSGVAVMPMSAALSRPVSDPRLGAAPNAATVPLDSASQYPDPFGSGAMPIVRSETLASTWLHVTVTSLGCAHDETKSAAMDPEADAAAPMERTGGPAQPPNWCRMMSRWIQHPPGDAGLQAEFVVADPPKPS